MHIGFDNGFFKVLSFHGRDKNRSILWDCECKCGKHSILSSVNLRRSDTKSCGCSRKGKNKNIKHTTTHGLSNHPIYKTYHSMKDRCNSTRDARFYKDKGIKVCKEWNDDFLTFFRWSSLNGWKKGLTLDRKDNSKGYSPENCQFITRSENSKKTPIENRCGEKSHLSKLSTQEVEKILLLLAEGKNGPQIAKMFSVTKQTIYCIKNKKTWISTKG